MRCPYCFGLQNHEPDFDCRTDFHESKRGMSRVFVLTQGIGIEGAKVVVAVNKSFEGAMRASPATAPWTAHNAHGRYWTSGVYTIELFEVGQ